MAGKRKRRAVPEVLVRAYGGCLKTLESVLLSLLPDPPADSPLDCSCNGLLCFGCLGRPYLIRDEDPADYLRFVTHSLCFLYPVRPPFPANFSVEGFCLRRVCGIFSACAFKCFHAWDMLLDRVGDDLMVYLLQNSSIFIPLANHNYLQVAGEPLKVRKFQVLSLKHQHQKKNQEQSKAKNIMQLRCHKRRPLLHCMLRRVYGGRVRTLKSTILILLPTLSRCSPLDCFCQGKLCLGCLGVSYLIQSGDPEDYCKLLLNTYCILPFSAPEPPSNFLASGLTIDIQSFFSIAAVPFTNAWDFLLGRIGDELMIFLLKYSAIFIACTKNCCWQIVGRPLNNVFTEDIKHSVQKVGKIGDFCSSNSRKDSAEYGSRKRRREFSWQRRRKHRKLVEANRSGSESYCDEKLEDRTSINFFETNNRNDRYSRHRGECQEQSKKSISKCFSCVLLNSQSKVKLGALIERKVIFYAKMSSNSLLPSRNILNRLRSTNYGVLHLLNNIFVTSSNEAKLEVLCSCLNQNLIKRLCLCLNNSNSKCLFHSLLVLLKTLIRNNQRCQYKELLWRHCLNPVFKKDITIRDDSELEPTVNSYSTHHQVISFVWAATRSVVPKEFLGDSTTWRAMRKNISKFVKLRRFEHFSLKQCMQSLKPSRYPFLSKFTCYHCSTCEYHDPSVNRREKKKWCGIPCGAKFSLQNKLFRCWIYWYFSHLVVPMIQNNFYVTERQSGRHDIFYYPKPIWKKLLEQAVAQLKDKNYSILDQASLEKLLKERKIRLRGRAFGFSRVRFLPKEKNVRALVNLRAPSKLLLQSCDRSVKIHHTAVESKSKFLLYKAVNSALGELRVVLRRIKAEDPSKLGASVFDYNDIYFQLHQFIPRVRRRTAAFPKLYIVVADVCKAFDTIDQDMLISIMNDVIQQDAYCLRGYSKVICTKKSIKAVPERLCFDHGNMNKNTIDSNANLQLNSSHCVLIDKGTCVDVNKHTLMCTLMEHLKHNILQIGHNFYLQKVGIPQGSILSSILCCFYYGRLESHVILPFLEKAHGISSKACPSDLFMQPSDEHGGESHERFCNGNKCPSTPHNLLLRLIDDFLFVSTSKEVAESFFARMRRGFRAYNCYMNLEKFGLNFEVENPPTSQRFFTGEDGVRFIPWSGLLINCETLEIQADYTRYWDAHVNSSITFQAGAKPGRTLGKKLCDYMRPKCHPLFYDFNINSQATVALNAYQAFLLCAMKFHCYLRAMQSTSRQSWSYIFHKIFFSFRYMHRLIKKRMRELGIRLNIKPVLKLKRAEIVWLGLSAYVRVLKKKQSRYRELLCLLKGKAAEHRIDGTSPHLMYAVHDSHSSMFWKIRF